MRTPAKVPFRKRLLHHTTVAGGALGLTTVFFLVLPLMQAISKKRDADTVLRSVDSTMLPPPPPPPEPEPEKEEPEEKPQELDTEPEPLLLSQLELALSDSFSAGWGAGNFKIDLNAVIGDTGDEHALFSLADLDQAPVVYHQPGPSMNAKMRKKAPGWVYVIFEVNQKGRVERPMVQDTSDAVFERPALSAIKKWRFEPGKRNGEPVRFRMREKFVFRKR